MTAFSGPGPGHPAPRSLQPDDVRLPQGAGFIPGHNPIRAYVAGRTGVEALDLPSGKPAWTSTEATLPIRERDELLLALLVLPSDQAQLVGLDRAGARTFRSQSFPFRAHVPGSVRAVTQPDGSELVSWSHRNPCGGVGSPGCNQPFPQQVRIAAITGQAVASASPASVPSVPCTAGLQLAEIPRAMRTLEPIAPWISTWGEPSLLPNPFYFRGVPTMVANNAKGAALYRLRTTDDRGVLDQFSLGTLDRWEITADGTHLAVFGKQVVGASSQALRVYALETGKQLFTGGVPMEIDPTITIAGAQVLYVHLGASGNQLVAAGVSGWARPVAAPTIEQERPQATSTFDRR